MEVLADTPAKSVGSPLFTSENAREMNRRAVEARRQNKLAEQERILSLEQQVKTVQPLLAKAVAETLEPRNSFVATRLRIAREQLCQLDEQLSQATDPKAIKAICVNNHDALKAACQMALGHIEQFDTSGSRSMEYHAVTTVLRGVIGNARFYR